MFSRVLGAAVMTLLVAFMPPAVTAADDEAAKKTEPPLEDLGTRSQGIDWPSFLGPNRDSKSPETGIISPWPEDGLRIVWQREIEVGYGIGTVSKGRFFHYERIKGGRRAAGMARLYCLNAETGEEIWSFDHATVYSDLLGYNNGPRCSPVVDGNRVYIFGVEGLLHCVRASDGELLWKVDTATKYNVVKNFFGVGSTPIVEGDLLICMVGGSPPGEPEDLYAARGVVDSTGTCVVAFNKFTGDVVYEIGDDHASYATPKLTTIDDRRWCFMFARGGLVGFEPTKGEIDFRYPWRSRLLESVNASTPVVVGNEVFISETYSIGSSLLSVENGSYDVVWKDDRLKREKAMRAHWNTPIYVDGHLYGCSGRNPPDADLRCIEWKTGKPTWIERAEYPSRSSLLYVDGHFIVLEEYGTLQLIKANPEKFELVSEQTLRRDAAGQDPIDPGKPPRLLRYPCWAAPILSHGLLYVRGDDRLVCMELIPEQ